MTNVTNNPFAGLYNMDELIETLALEKAKIDPRSLGSAYTMRTITMNYLKQVALVQRHAHEGERWAMGA